MGKRILIVDDATFIRMIVKSILVPRGFEIAGDAANGTEAVRKYFDLKPDLVTMDITMNEKDGLQAAKEILERRWKPSHRGLPRRSPPLNSTPRPYRTGCNGGTPCGRSPNSTTAILTFILCWRERMPLSIRI